jgi:hypothetical protein
MQSVDPFIAYTKTVDRQTVMANVNRWRIANGKPIDPGFKNNPRILKLSGKSIAIAIDRSTGECEVNK